MNQTKTLVGLFDKEAPAPSPTLSVPTGIRVLEVVLIVLMLFESGVLHEAYWLIQGYPLLHVAAWSNGWVIQLLRRVAALGVLGYILFRRIRSRRSKTSLRLPETKYVVAFELALVVLVAFGSSVYHSLGILVESQPLSDPPSTARGIWLRDTWGMLHQTGALALVGLLLYGHSRDFKSLGLRWSAKDAAWALPLATAGYLASGFLAPLALWSAEAYAGHTLPEADIGWHLHGPTLTMATVLALILNGFFEELIVRAYLMTAIMKLFNSAFLAIGLSVIVQVSYHFYQGAPAALTHIGWCLLFSWFYCKTGRILPLVLAHNFNNLCSLLSYMARQGAGV